MGCDLAGLTTVVWAVWRSSSPFSRLSLELESVFNVWQCCPKYSSIILEFFFQKVTFPVRADVCHQLLILRSGTCLSILCAKKKLQRSTVTPLCTWQSLGAVWSLSQNHRFSYSVRCRTFIISLFFPQFWSDIFSYIFLNSDSQMAVGATSALQMKWRVLVTPM